MPPTNPANPQDEALFERLITRLLDQQEASHVNDVETTRAITELAERLTNIDRQLTVVQAMSQGHQSKLLQQLADQSAQITELRNKPADTIPKWYWIAMIALLMAVLALSGVHVSTKWATLDPSGKGALNAKQEATDVQDEGQGHAVHQEDAAEAPTSGDVI